MAPCLHVFISLFLVDVEVALIRGGVGDVTLDEEWQVELVRAAAAGGRWLWRRGPHCAGPFG